MFNRKWSQCKDDGLVLFCWWHCCYRSLSTGFLKVVIAPCTSQTYDECIPHSRRGSDNSYSSICVYWYFIQCSVIGRHDENQHKFMRVLYGVSLCHAFQIIPPLFRGKEIVGTILGQNVIYIPSYSIMLVPSDNCYGTTPISSFICILSSLCIVHFQDLSETTQCSFQWLSLSLPIFVTCIETKSICWICMLMARN